jgi:hypothetical protein
MSTNTSNEKYLGQIVDVASSASTLMNGVNDVVLNQQLASNSIAITLTLAGAGAQTITEAQLQQAMISQLILDNNSIDVATVLLPNGLVAGASAAAFLQSSLGLSAVGDSAVLNFVRTGLALTTLTSVSLSGDVSTQIMSRTDTNAFVKITALDVTSGSENVSIVSVPVAFSGSNGTVSGVIGALTVTGLAGVVTITDVGTLAAGAVTATITITNVNVLTTSVVQLSINSQASAGGAPVVFVKAVTANTFTFAIANAGSAAFVAGNIGVAFQIIN